MSAASTVDDARRALDARLADEDAWLVGGAVRDELLGRPTTDLDVVVGGDPRRVARDLGGALGVPVFPLSERFGTWRVVGEGWQVDVSAAQGDGTLAGDLARRDLTINAIARPVGGGAIIDPHDGAGDLAARRLRMVTATAFDEDPVRMLRVARFAGQLGFDVDEATAVAVTERASLIEASAGERVFLELRELVTAPDPLRGLAELDRLRLTEHVLPELSGLRGIEQNRYHHLDVHDHTLLVLEHSIALERDPAAVIGGLAPEHADAIRAQLALPLADGLTRAGALRFAALLHDVSKPQTQARAEDGTVLGFPQHAQQGAERVRDTMRRLRASERLSSHLAALTRHHLGLGFLVHAQPLDARAIYRYLRDTYPVQVDVSLLSIADRLATGGHKAEVSIERHMAIARRVLPEALTFDDVRSRPPLVRGDELASRLSLPSGPLIGELLERIAESRYAGEIEDAEQALVLARAELAARSEGDAGERRVR